MALAARTEEGITAFIVEKEPGPRFEGIAVSKHVGKLGYRGVETVEMAYTDHRIPATNVIGELGRGLPQILGVLEVGRINIAARAVGVARAAFDAALAYSMQRETMGKVIGEHQAIQLKLADMATRLEAARLLTRNAAEREAKGLRCDVEAGMAKLFASETALDLATEAMRIHGGVGYTTEFPVERYYRDAPLMVIGEGTNEIQRIVIARGLLARPRRTSSLHGLGLHSGSPRVAVPFGPARAASSASTSSVCSPSRGAGAAGPTGRSEKLTGPLTERRLVPSASLRSSRKPSLAASCGSSSTSAGPCAGAHHTPTASKRSAHSARVALGHDVVEHGDHLGPVGAQRPGVGEAGVVQQVRPLEGAADAGRCGDPPRGR